MKIQIVAILDRAAAAYGRPFFVNALGQAIRSFQDEVNRNAPENTMYHHADDYDLWHLAEYDDNTGHIEALKDGPKQIAIGKQMKQGA